MASSSVAGIIAAVGTLITSLALLVGAIPLLLKTLRDLRQVHEIVNQQRTDMQRYQRALVASLIAHGIDVPVDQSIDPEDNPTFTQSP
jgi:hypothetical protein